MRGMRGTDSLGWKPKSDKRLRRVFNDSPREGMALEEIGGRNIETVENPLDAFHGDHYIPVASHG